MAQDYVERAAWRLIEGVAGWPRLRTLEMGCADGRMLERCASLGAEVSGTTYREAGEDYVRRREHPESIADRITGGVDLNRGLPFEDASFDLVYSIEVIEHVESHHRFIAEAARVLKPGGWFVLTTPNLHRLNNRFRYMLTGVHQLKREPLPVTVGPEGVEEYHHRCVDLCVLHPMMWMHGLRIERMEVAKAKPLSSALSVVAPLFSPLTRRLLTRRCKSDEDRDAKLDLARWLNARAVCTSEQICLVARKVEATGAAP